MKTAKKNIYFPGLDGLRALAAFAVLWTHVERYKQFNGQATLTSIAFNSFIGGMAVTFFFVLSGFLITWLLLQEKQRTGAINTAHFLWKRFLRIAPLYYLTLITGYLVSIYFLHDTNTNFFSNGFLLNFILLPNIAFAFAMIPEILVQIWSIGTEVQFYLLWPFLVRKNDPKKMARIFLGIILVWTALRLLLLILGENKSALAVILFRTRLDCMAIGGLFALGMSDQMDKQHFIKKTITFLVNHVAGWMLEIIFALMLYMSWLYNAGYYPGYALLFGCLIIKQIHHPTRILTFNILNYLGKISYGIYLLHHFCVYLAYWLLGPILGDQAESSWNEVIYFMIAALSTVLLASASYYLIEKRFLAMKQRI